MTVLCPECESDVETPPSPRACRECGSGYHVLDGEAYHVPVIDRGRLVASWKGYGASFLTLLDGSYFPGFIATRLGVVCGLTETRTRRIEKRISEMNDALNLFGLEWTFIDRDLEHSESHSPDSPGYISRLGGGEVPIDLVPVVETGEDGIEEVPENLPDQEEIVGMLSEIYPTESLYDEQEMAIRNVIGEPGGMTFCILPTGMGKTRIAHAAGLSSAMGAGPTLIISPTISLIDDQRKEWKLFNEEIRERNRRSSGEEYPELRCEFLTSEHLKMKGGGGIVGVFRQVLEGELDVLCCSPEILISNYRGYSFNDLIPQIVSRGRPSFSNFIFDEAHILYDWGESIRPHFLMLNSIERTMRKLNPSMHTTMMSATLAPRESDWIANSFGRAPSEVNVIRPPRVREDLAFTVIKRDEDSYIREGSALLQSEYNPDRLEWRKSNYMDQCSPLLIYTGRPDGCNEIRKRLNLGRTSVYHGSTGGSKRQKVLLDFQRNELDALVATSAFGMGVNKPDIWLTGYIGSPFTLREVYQMFGRTARGSEWNSPGGTPRNGNCIAILPDRLPKQSYKPDMLPPKLLEKILQSIGRGVFTENGYVMFSLEPMDNLFWEPDHKESWYDRECTGKKWKGHTSISRIESIIEKELAKIVEPSEFDRARISREVRGGKFGWEEFRKRRRSKIPEKILRAVIILEMGGFIEIQGLHQGNPTIVDGKKGPSLAELLESGGYESVLRDLSESGKQGKGINTSKNWKFVVAKVKREISGINALKEALNEGLGVLRNWYEVNREELRDFMKVERCIRQGFGPVLGIKPDEVESCLDNFIRIRSQRSSGGAPELPVAPCSFCRSNASKSLSSEVSGLISFDEGNPSIWMTSNLIDAIVGETEVKKEHEGSVFSKSVKGLPYEGFLCGFPKFLQDELDREILVTEAVRNSRIVEQGMKKTIPCNLLNDRGEESGEVEFICEIIGSLSSGYFLCRQIKPPKTNVRIFGFLFYIVDGDLFAREVKSDQAKDAYRAIKRGWEKTGGREPIWLEKNRFIGSKLPIDGSGTKSWDKLG